MSERFLNKDPHSTPELCEQRRITLDAGDTLLVRQQASVERESFARRAFLHVGPVDARENAIQTYRTLDDSANLRPCDLEL